MKLSEIKLKPPKCIFYGPFGSGKTCFAATGGEVVQFLDMNEGLMSAKTLQDKWTEERKKVDVIECHEDDPTKATAFLKARSYIQSVASQCSTETYKFKILVIDSLTDLQEFCMRNILSNAGRLGKQAEIQHWQLRDIEFLNLMIIIKSLPIAVILIAHQQIVEQDGINVISPGLPGKSLPNNLFTKFDEILFFKARNTTSGKVEFLIQNTSSSSILTRTRANIKNEINVDIGLIEYLKLLGYVI